jgi:predicted acylesterase/phospholipase RssA
MQLTTQTKLSHQFCLWSLLCKIMPQTRMLLPAICGLLFLAGCAGSLQTIALGNDDIGVDKTGTVFVTSQATGSASFVASKPHNILVLTSGGADGAFGAGALVSWTRSGKRPQFDVVSGVSTGALQASLAFLGSKYDYLLESVYTQTTTKDVLASNGFSGLYGGGLYESSPLRQKLISVLNRDVLDEIAKAYLSGRRLYVTTTDLSFGRSFVWDMGAIAASGGADRQTRFINVLLASVAVPGLIEPVAITRPGVVQPEMHGDGGVKTPVPLHRFMMRGRKGKRQVTVIANGHVSAFAATTSSSASTLPLARRGISLLMRRLLFLSAELQAFRLSLYQSLSPKLLTPSLSTLKK